MRYLTIAGHIGNYKSLKGKVDRSPPDRDTCHDLGASIFFNFVFFFYYYFNTRAGDVASSCNI